MWSQVSGAWMKWREETLVYFCDRKMSLRLKSKKYRTLARYVALFGTESWPTIKAAERRIQAMEIRINGWYMGISLREHIPNKNFRRRFEVTFIDETVRENRTIRFGDVTRAAPENVASTAYYLEVDRTRPRGRMKHRCEDINAELKASH